jgi:hypothetical protein
MSSASHDNIADGAGKAQMGAEPILQADFFVPHDESGEKMLADRRVAEDRVGRARDAKFQVGEATTGFRLQALPIKEQDRAARPLVARPATRDLSHELRGAIPIEHRFLPRISERGI